MVRVSHFRWPHPPFFCAQAADLLRIFLLGLPGASADPTLSDFFVRRLRTWCLYLISGVLRTCNEQTVTRQWASGHAYFCGQGRLGALFPLRVPGGTCSCNCDTMMVPHPCGTGACISHLNLFGLPIDAIATECGPILLRMCVQAADSKWHKCCNGAHFLLNNRSQIPHGCKSRSHCA